MSAGVTIREASDAEIRDLQLTLVNDPDKSIQTVATGSELLDETVFLILENGLIAGFITLRNVSDEIFPIFVFSPFRRRGVAVEGMRKLVDRQRSKGRSELILDVVEGAESFWGEVFSGFSVRHICDRKFSVDIS